MRRPLPLARFAGLEAPGDPSRGLAETEAGARRSRYGSNDILESPPGAWRELLRETARDPMLWFLVGTSALYAALGETAEAVTLAISVLPLVGMDVVLHQRTRASTEGLRSRLAANARVVRDGAERTVPATELVPGDLVVVPSGEPFPADGVVVGGEELQADESALTGESFPARKRPLEGWPRGEEPPVDEAHWGLAGTRLLTGTARLRVAFTGPATLYGEIVRSAAAGEHARTPLQQAIAGLVRALLAAAAVLCVILAWVRLRQGFGWVDALVSAVTLAVAALPEEFPVVFVMFLGVGVHRLARRRALVRRSVSVENIGRVTCICSDKTGTLTRGELQLAHLLPAQAGADAPETDTAEAAARDAGAALLLAAARASRDESGDPLDVAILRAAREAGLDVGNGERLALFPFTEHRRRETAVFPGEGAAAAATKGSPEVILGLCSLAAAERDAWLGRVEELAAAGHRVIACATRALPAGEFPGGEPDRGFTFVGLLALEDPVRESASDAIARCRAAGIHTLLVTGDHPATAAAVAREVGLGDGHPRVITGDDLDALLAREGVAALRGVHAVARALPARKLALVRALQADGEIVAVTGDGVNDVPALQAADIGLALGARATRSAREVADIVLLDDDFDTLVRAIAEGRQLFRNLTLSFRYLLLVHIPLVVTAALVPLAGYPLLYLPIHIVWLELVIHPSAMLAFQAVPAPGVLAPRRGRATARFFSGAEWARIAVVGTLLTVLVTAGYDRSLGPSLEVAHARAMALVILSLASALLVAMLSGLRTRAARVLSVATVALAAVVVQVPPLAARLHVAPLHADDWLLATAGVLLACAPLWLRRNAHDAEEPVGPATPDVARAGAAAARPDAPGAAPPGRR